MLRALIVDDDPVNTRFLSEILAPHATCDVAENGRRGLEAFGRALTDGTPYDIIFLDVMMPGMEPGPTRQALERMRQPETSQGAPFPGAQGPIMVSAWTIPPCTGPFSRPCPLSFWASPFSGETSVRTAKIESHRLSSSERSWEAGHSGTSHFTPRKLAPVSTSDAKKPTWPTKAMVLHVLGQQAVKPAST